MGLLNVRHNTTLFGVIIDSIRWDFGPEGLSSLSSHTNRQDLLRADMPSAGSQRRHFYETKERQRQQTGKSKILRALKTQI